MKGWKDSIEEKGNMYMLGKHKPKMTYLTTLYLSHTLQAIEDLYDLKSCELPTLMENGMPNKPMESYTLLSHVSERSSFNSSSTNSI